MKSGLKMECHLSGRIADKNIADVVPVSRAVGRSGPREFPRRDLTFADGKSAARFQ